MLTGAALTTGGAWAILIRGVARPRALEAHTGEWLNTYADFVCVIAPVRQY